MFTSIGPGAVQALAGCLAASSDGIVFWHLYADETTEAEGPNMQQIPGGGQEQFLKLASMMGPAVTPAHAVGPSRGAATRPQRRRRPAPRRAVLSDVADQHPAATGRDEPRRAATGAPPGLGAAMDNGRYEQAARALLDAAKVVVRVGGGARNCGPEIDEILSLVDGFAVTSPISSSGVLPYTHPRNLTVGGSKGSISGNFAMENADMAWTDGCGPA